jgi:tight adherence protein C
MVYLILLIPIEKRNYVKTRVRHVFSERKEGELPPSLIPGEEQKKKESFIKRVIQPIWLEAKKGLSKRSSDKHTDKWNKQLTQAGNPFQMKGTDYRMVQYGLLLGFPLLSVLYGLLLGVAGKQIVIFLFIGLGIGMILPRYYIKMKINQRKKQAMLELPDFVDLLLVSLEAGLGFDAALSKVIGKQEGVLAKEFRRCLEELRLGLTRREALIGVRDRIEVEELSVFINSVLRAEKLGVGMVQVLRVLTADVRAQRRQRAEETAMKAPIKILFPLIFFIFPSLFIVILGPAVIQLINQFMK